MIITGGMIFTGGFSITSAAQAVFYYIPEIYSSSTVLLLQADKSYFSDDISVFNSVLTSTAATATSFVPSSFTTISAQDGSGYFGGAAYLSLTDHAGFSLGTGDFTFEAWVYLDTAATGVNRRIFTNWASNANSYQFYIRSATNRLTWQSFNSSSADVAALQITSFVWTHVAFCRSGTTVRTFINGTLADTVTGVTNNLTGVGTPTIGGNNGGGEYWLGYISNLRIIHGRALYTGAFTVPTAALTLSPSPLDASNFSFDLAASSYVSTPSNVNIFYGTADFTIECWFRLTNATSSYRGIWAQNNTVLRFGDAGFGDKLQFAVDQSSVANIWSCAVTASSVLNTWTHVAWTRINGANRLYVNGVLQSIGSGSNPASYPSTSFTGAGSITSGGVIGNLFVGQISNVRITNGYAVYSGNFTPPTNRLTTTQSTGTSNILPINSSVQPYSVSFNGSSQYLSIPSSAALTFGSGSTVSPMTAEAWFYTTTPATDQTVVSQYASGSSGWSIRLFSGAMRVALTGDTTLITGTTTLAANTWYHAALSGSAGSWKLFLNGVQEGATQTGSVTMGDGAVVQIGRLSNVSYFNGYISNVRIVKGLAVYTGAFTTPTSRLTTTQSSGTNIAAITNPTPTYSALFNGSNQYLTIPYNSVFNIPASTPVCFEAWVYTTSSNTFVMANRNWSFGSSGATWAFYLNGGVTPEWGIAGTGQTTFGMATSTLSGTLGQWNHYAFTRDSFNIVRIFVNGQVGVSRVDSQAMTNASGSIYIGVSSNLASPYANGYMSNIRFVLGSGVYTGAFTPPSSTLPVVAGTSLLALQSATFVDNSVNAFTITPTGSPTTNTFSPFGAATTLLTLQDPVIQDNSALASSITNTGAATTSTQNPFGSTALLTAQDSVIRDNSIYSATLSQVGGPTTSPFTPFGVTVLLTLQNNGSIDNNIIENFARIQNTSTVITRTGTPTPGTFSPFSPTNWGTYFNGSSDYLISTGTFAITSAFTIDVWIYATALTGFGIFTGSDTFNVTLGTTAAATDTGPGAPGAYIFIGSFSPWIILVSPVPIVINTWYHVAATYDGYATSLYLNGVLVNSGIINWFQTPATNVVVGRRWDLNTPGVYWAGYISNLRVVNNISLYAASGTVPALPAPSFSVPQSRATLTQSAGTNIAAIGSSGYSYYFGGSQYLIAANLPIIRTSAFTIEVWVFPTATNTQAPIISYYNSTGGFRFFIAVQAATNYGSWGLWTGATPVLSVNTGQTNGLHINKWTHIVVQRNAANLTSVYINGIVSHYATLTTDWTAGIAGGAVGAWIGGDAQPNYFTGYMSNFRFVLGAAVYTGSFIPPRTSLVAAQTAGTNVSAITAPTYSYVFNGSSQYISIASSTAFAFGAGVDFTVEAWVYPLAYGGTVSGGSIIGTTNGALTGWSFNLGQDINNFRVISNAGGSWADLITAGTGNGPALNVWTHVAFVRIGGSLFLYKNGVQVGSTVTGAGAYSFTSPNNAAYIGYFYDATNTRYFNGYISNVRVVKGLAVYTGAFITPTSQLTTTQTAGTNIAAINPIPTYSYSFNGTNQSLTIGYPVNWSTLGAFTLETWIYFSSISPAYVVFFTTGVGATGYTTFYIYGSGTPANVGSIAVGINGTNEIKSANNVIAAGQWYHVAYTYDGFTTNIFVNGLSVLSATTAVYANNTDNLVIGAGNSSYLSGYMSNIRLTRGQTVYTGQFNPPTTALTSIQSSGTNISDITAPVASFSYNYSGSNYLSVPITAAQFGSSNWTVECWVYLNSIGSVYHVIGSYGYSSVTTRSWVIYIDLTGTLRLAQSTTGSDNFDAGFGTPTFAANTWYHVAVVRNGATITAYRNGVALSSTQTPQTLFVSSAVFTIGSDLTNSLAGYISNLRIVKSTAVYTGRFTPQNSPLTVTQVAGNNITAITSLATSYAYSFNGTTQYLSMSSSPSLQLATATPFTIEAWIYSTNMSVADHGIIGKRAAGNEWQLNIHPSFGYLNFWNGTTTYQSNITLVVNTWYHVAVTWDTATLRFFVNGAMGSTYTGVTITPSTNQLTIGGVAAATSLFAGYISNLRIVKGTAVYRSAFTPQGSPLTTTQSAGTNIAAITAPVPSYAYSFTGANYIQVPHSANFAFSNRNFTIEFWVYFNSISTTSNVIGKRSSSASSGGTFLFWLAGNNLNLYMSGDNSTWSIFSASVLVSPVVNTWYHVALVRNGYSFTSYINGAGTALTPLLTTATTSAALIASPTANTEKISIGGTNGGGDYLNGYVSNLRIVNGLAVYTGNFTVPNAPLTTTQSSSTNIAAIPVAAHTVLLTAQSPTVADNSIFAATITNNATVTATNAIQPFLTQTSILTGQLSTIADASNYAVSFTNTGIVTAVSGVGPFGVTSLLTAQSASIVDNSNYGWALTNTNAVTTISTSAFTTQVTVLLAQSASIVDSSDYSRAILNNNTVTAVNSVQPFNSPVTLLTAQTATIIDSSVYALSITNTGVVTATNVVQPLAAVYLLTAQSTTLVDNSSYVRTLTTSGVVVITTGTSAYQPLPVSFFMIADRYRYTDSSQHKWALGTVGAPTLVPQSPLPATDAYNDALNGSSIYFAGASQYLTLTQQSEQYYMTGAFTFETWIYSTSASGYIFGNFNNQTGANSWWIGYNNAAASVKIFFSKEIYGNGAAAKYTNTLMPLNQWNHLAIGRDESSSWFILLNGASYSLSTSTSGTVTWTDNYSFNAAGMGAAATSPLNINGIATSQGITGYYSDMRFVNGVAIYNTTTNLGPPTQPLTLIGTTQTVLLLNGRPGGIIDATGKNNLTTVGGAKISQAVFKYGTGSLSFNGSTDYLSVRSSQLLAFGTGDFTVEFWMNATAAGTFVAVVGTQSIAGNTTAGMWRISNRINSVNGMYFNYTTGSAFTDITFSTTNYNDSTWHHIVACRASGILRMFVDGISIGTPTALSQNLTSNQALYIGYQAQDSQYYTGYIDDLRISGIARYTTTATFTPPTAALSTGTYIQMA
jgi:hypothetical protein